MRPHYQNAIAILVIGITFLFRRDIKLNKLVALCYMLAAAIFSVTGYLGEHRCLPEDTLAVIIAISLSIPILSIVALMIYNQWDR